MSDSPTLFRVTLEVRDSFYVVDPWGNDLCFCENGTLYT
jgi:hypothetical protein